jgi:hypothetical protein
VSKLSLCQSNWNGERPWICRDAPGDIRRGVSLSSYHTESYLLTEINNMNKFEESIDTLLFLNDEILYYHFFDFENKKVSVINYTSKTITEYDILKTKKRNVNKEKNEGIFTLKIKRGKTKVNYHINTYDDYFCTIVYSKKLRMGFMLKNKISGTIYKTDD